MSVPHNSSTMRFALWPLRFLSTITRCNLCCFVFGNIREREEKLRGKCASCNVTVKSDNKDFKYIKH